MKTQVTNNAGKWIVKLGNKVWGRYATETEARRIAEQLETMDVGG